MKFVPAQSGSFMSSILPGSAFLLSPVVSFGLALVCCVATAAGQASDPVSTDAGSTVTSTPTQSSQALLISALKADSTSQESATLLAAYLSDPQVPVERRASVSALAKELVLENHSAGLPREQVLALRAQDARTLIAEFPEAEAGYRYLLNVARRSDLATGKAIVAELQSSIVPAGVRAEADRLNTLQGAVGKTLSVPGLDLERFRGKFVVIYGWTKDRPPSSALRGWTVTSGAVAFIGVNLDADKEAAQRTAEALKLPGTQYYDGAGLEGALATALDFGMDRSIYILDQQGCLQDIQGEVDFSSKLAKLYNPSFAVAGGVR